jgi:hypothetical protein
MSPWLTLLIFFLTFTLTCALVGPRILAEMGYREVEFFIGIPRTSMPVGIKRTINTERGFTAVLIALPFLHVHLIFKKR